MIGKTFLLARMLAGATVDEIRELRLRGNLDEAREQAEQRLAEPGLAPDVAIDLHLELAAIEDRIGLHQNTRPVAAALAHIKAAEALVPRASLSAEARLALAKADYYYRAEMREREFLAAAVHADRAIELFRGEYERHVGFIHLVEGDTECAIPYFERSLAARREAEAIDASMFAATTLASALVDVGRHEEALPHLTYAMMLAEKLDSPTGKARTGLVLSELYEKSGDSAAARSAFEMTLSLAEAISYASIVRRSREALERLGQR